MDLALGLFFDHLESIRRSKTSKTSTIDAQVQLAGSAPDW
jgi:hypothetical protein